MMEVIKGVNSGVTVVGSDAPTDYHIVSRTGAPATVAGAPASHQSPASLGMKKKKRGRPKKYAHDGPVTVALSVKPIPAVAPATAVIDFSADKRPKVKATATAAVTAAVVKQHHSKVEAENIGESVSCSVGANFTPHIITVHAGEEVTMKVMSFSQQGPRAICILSANGVISSVTLRQPNSSGGTLTYEGRFEILSLTGSFMPSESGGIKNTTGGMSVSLANSEGRVIGGGVAGLLVAASTIQIVVGSFLAGNQNEQKPKKQKSEYIISGGPTSTVNFSSVGVHENFMGRLHHGSSIGYSSFHEDTTQTRNGSADRNDSYNEI